MLAHPESRSFTANLARHGLIALQQAGHSVDFVDLYSIAFDPVSDRRNFVEQADTARFDQQQEERFASSRDSFAPELQLQMDRLAACDLLVLQFPIWWLGMPAIMKGWVDRVFAIGRTYGGGQWFDRGMMKSKKAMLAVTIGGTEQAYSHQGIYGPAAEVLRPINHGILGFCGFDVIEPLIAYAPARRTAEDRRAMFEAYAERLINIESAPRLPALRSDDYENFVLKTSDAGNRTRGR